MTLPPPTPPTPLAWPAIFALWRDDANPTEYRLTKALAHDIGAPFQSVRQWRMRNSVPVWYWPRLIDVLETRFGLMVSYRQLVEATIQARAPRQKEAA